MTPQAYLEDVVDYTKETYAYDSWGQALKVSTETYYKRIIFQNGYELLGTRKKTEPYWNGYIVYTYYDYRTY